MSVKRYNMTDDDSGYAGRDYVLASDYDSLRAQLEKAEAVIAGLTNDLADEHARGYQRGAREMRERAVKLCDERVKTLNQAKYLNSEQRAQQTEAGFLSMQIRDLPLESLPTGPSESTKV